MAVATRCQVCQSTTIRRVIEEVPDYLTGERFAVHQCGRCEFTVTEPQPKSVERYYPARYRRYSVMASTVLRLLYHLRARGWTRRLGGPGVALEIGCGDGWMLRVLREQGWQVVGTERSLEQATFPAGLNRLPVFVGDLNALRPVARFDAIILYHVLEHLRDPVETIRQCAGLLKSDGHLIIAVPNISSWQARIFGSLWFHLDVPRHYYHFSLSSLSRLLSLSGLNIVRTSFVSFEHDPYGWVQSCLNTLGFRQNLLTRILMRLPGERASIGMTAAVAGVSALLAIPSIVLSMCSWLAHAGAVVEVWAVKA